MNYTSLKIGMTLTIAVFGIFLTHIAYNSINNVMEKQAEKLEELYSF